MKIIIAPAKTLAELAAGQCVSLLQRKPQAVFGLATGSTPLGLYAELSQLVKNGVMSFRLASSFNLDEYLGLDGDHEQSYRYFMNENLFRHIDLPIERTHVPSGIGVTPESAAEYDGLIEAAGGIDLQLLGIGRDGHIGFNEPGTDFGSRTHIVELTAETREDNARFFGSIDEVPTHAVTMGIRTVMNARSIILMALGKSKAQCIRETVKGPITPEIPASILQLHPDVTVYLDEEAASLL